MRARAELLALHGFLRVSTRAETADGLLRSLRQHFGADRTAAMRMDLELSCCRATATPGVNFYLPELFPPIIALFEEMFREVATHDLENDKRGILRRKWTNVTAGWDRGLHVSTRNEPHIAADYKRVRQLMDELAANRP